MSGLSTCRECNAWIYWQDYTAEDGRTKHVPYDEPGFFTMHWATCAAGEYVTVSRTAYKVEKCKRCGHRVYWETTARGKRRPMDVYQDEDSLGWIADGYCHFETCVGARSSYVPPPRDPHQARPAASTNGHTVSSEVQRLVRLWGPDLGVAWPCTRVDITTAFRQKALKHHPDMGGQARDFIRCKRAYDALKDQVPA